jgi:hypothetical protein
MWTCEQTRPVDSLDDRTPLISEVPDLSCSHQKELGELDE